MLSKAVLTAVPLVAWAGPHAMTENGKVEGTDNGGFPEFLHPATVEAFFGIPYAAPPVGENRLRPPQPFVDSWRGTRSAKEEGGICGQTEDCLFLNVHRPAKADEGSDIPTIVWIHGGGFVGGDGLHVFGHGKDFMRLYDPTNIVERHGHVFVGLNYRLSSLGFLALPELEAENGVAGNMGVLDQRAALQWVQRNIRGFGGDPQKVTVQGESAGGMSVMFHLTSPGSKGLFHGAIMESPTHREGCFFQNKTDSFAFAREWTALRGCPQTGPELLTCLRQLNESEFRKDMDAHVVKDWNERRKHREDKDASALPADIPNHACSLYPLNPYGVVVDGSSTGMPDWPVKLLEAGEFNQVPLINGANINGGAMFGFSFPLLWGDWPYPVDGSGVIQAFNISNLRHMMDIKKVARWFLPNKQDQDRFIELYGGHEFDDFEPGEQKDTWIIDRIDRFWRDSFFLCPARETAMHWSSHGVPVYEYVFSFEMHTNILPVVKDLWSTHAFELPFVFRNWIKGLGRTFLHPRQYEKMTDVMSCTWASFVKCQKPKCPTPPPHCADALEDVPEWPAFSGQDRKYISLKHNTTIETIKSHVAFPDDEFPGDDRCDFWKSVDFSWHDTIRRWPFEPEQEDDLLV